MIWLSFADATRPAGEQFLGACVLDADDIVEAVRIAHLLKINPGGEVLGVKIPDDQTKFPVGMLLSRQEISAMEGNQKRETDAVRTSDGRVVKVEIDDAA